MYQALYRKWRPKVFADVIGQPHITETLRRQVAEGRTSHAYLFTGTRGTGKTTCAKILAKAVNCEHPVNGDPCGQCAACMDIENGGVDVLELDAASNSGVDQVRALRSEAIYSPANVKKRVYIIDEVHMLSDAAFNALLKIMEEPPEHLLFILATTEVHKILPTILSRCQRFSFRRIPARIIAQRLLYVAEQEGIDLRPDGADLLSHLADGALRDGLSLLDQCAAPGGAVDADAVLDVLGLMGTIQTAYIMEAALRRDIQNALTQLDRLYHDGKDMGTVLSELASLTRDLLLRKMAPEGGMELLSGSYDTELLDKLGRGVSKARFLYFASTLQKTLSDLHFSSNRRLDVELCLLRLCDESLSSDLTALTARVQRMEDAFAGAAVSVPKAVPPQAPLKPEASPASRPVPKPVIAQTPEPEPFTDRTPKPEPHTERTSKPEPNTEQTSKPKPTTKRKPAPEPEPIAERRAKAGAAARTSQSAREDAGLPPLELLEPPPETRPEELPWEMLEPPPEKAVEAPPWEMPETPPERAAEAPPWEMPETSLEKAAEAPPREAAEAVSEGAAKPEVPAKTPEPAPPAGATGTVTAPPVIGAAIPAVTVEPSGEAPAVPVGNWWPQAKEKSKARLSPMYRAFLNCCTGVLEGGIVVIYVADGFTIGRLDNERVRTTLLEEAQAATGQAGITQLIFRVGNPPIGSPEENLNNLLKNFSGQYDNVEIT